MCVLAIAWESHAAWRLVVAANRDEFHDRPAEPLHRWADAAGIMAGRDLQAGGTWLAVSQSGRFAAVTNVRGEGAPVAGRASRGQLVVDLAVDGETLLPPSDFNPFNAILISGDDAVFRSNRPKSEHGILSPGLYGVSNGPFDTPAPKTLRLQAIMRDWLHHAEHQTEDLLAGLRDPHPPTIGPDTSIFVHDPVYGTRCSTLVVVDRRGRGMMIERRYDRVGDTVGDTALEFVWP